MMRAKVLSVDDDRTLNHLTRTAIHRFNRSELTLDVECAFSAAEAKSMLSKAQDPYAVVLLDVIMEHPEAGFDVADFLRHELKNDRTQIIMRSGQPGNKNRAEVLKDKRINQYYEKLELRDLSKLRSVIEEAVREFQASTPSGSSAPSTPPTTAA